MTAMCAPRGQGDDGGMMNLLVKPRDASMGWWCPAKGQIAPRSRPTDPGPRRGHAMTLDRRAEDTP
jgi:hypothetical protein